MPESGLILVTGAGGQVGAIGRNVTGLLLDRGFRVRAMVHREDDRANALRTAGAEVVVGDLLEPGGCLSGGQWVPSDLLRNVSVRWVSRGHPEHGGGRSPARSRRPREHVPADRFPDGSPATTPSPQHRQHWLGEQALGWTGLPVITIRPTVFLDYFFLRAAAATVRSRGRIELPFGRGKTSPVAAADVARVVATIVAAPEPHIGRLYELTGPRSQDMNGIAREYSDALNREITYFDVPPAEWERELRKMGLSEHLTHHLLTMAELHRAGRYDRLADGVERVTGAAMSVRAFVSLHADEFTERSG